MPLVLLIDRNVTIGIHTRQPKVGAANFPEPGTRLAKQATRTEVDFDCQDHR